jgi:hypothetical protein
LRSIYCLLLDLWACFAGWRVYKYFSFDSYWKQITSSLKPLRLYVIYIYIYIYIYIRLPFTWSISFRTPKSSFVSTRNITFNFQENTNNRLLMPHFLEDFSSVTIILCLVDWCPQHRHLAAGMWSACRSVLSVAWSFQVQNCVSQTAHVQSGLAQRLIFPSFQAAFLSIPHSLARAKNNLQTHPCLWVAVLARK